MTHLRIAGVLACSALLAGCTDYATFVTSTDVGINADATTETLNIGYVRTEAFMGPGYPETGSVPSAVGYISANLSAFSPQIKQLYATGPAAELVTQIQPPDTAAEKTDPLLGQRRPFFFGTGTNFGLKIGFKGNAPSSMKLGFNREEVSVIPMRQAAPGSGAPDQYASVLASINLNQTAGTGLTDTSVVPTQFFATGAAARNLAKRDDVRDLFKQQAQTAVKAGTSLSGDYTFDDSSTKLRTYWKPDGKTVDKTANTKVIDCMKKYNLNEPIAYLIYGPSKPERDIVISCLSI
jgi:hypothetical protein